MKNFSISELEALSGIRAHTLRTWEQRYGFPRPQRSSTNLRSYSLPEADQLLKIALLNRNGHRISNLCRMQPEELRLKLKSLGADEERQQLAVNELLFFMYDMDVSAFEQVLDDAFANWSEQTVLEKVVYPFIVKSNLLTSGKRLAYEHMAVTAVRKKLVWCIENTKVTPGNDPVVLFLPCTRQLDLGLLYMCFQLQHRGMQVLYLGDNVSIPNLEPVFKKYRPRIAYTYLHAKSGLSVDALASVMQSIVPQSKLVFTTHHPENSHNPQGNLFHFDFEEALRFMLEQ